MNTLLKSEKKDDYPQSSDELSSKILSKIAAYSIPMTADLRSDTVTRPSQAMKEAMFNAEVGDDVFSEDPTVNALQEFAAKLFDKEAALFCSSGTQTNQIAIACHTQPGDEVICSDLSHIYLYEGGGIALNASCSTALIEGDRGRITTAQIMERINPDDIHRPVSRLVSIEDTVNKGGGAIYETDEIQRISAFCREKNIALHCDGARLFNALAVTGISPAHYAHHLDSLSICLSKGLGAPVGSLLLGSKPFIKKALRRRKSMGGGMRQAGIIAAAGLYALQHNVNRLAEDHERAKTLGKHLSSLSWVKDVMPVDTNIVIFEVTKANAAEEYVQKLKGLGVLCFTFGPSKIRFVTHADFTDEHLDHAIRALSAIA